MALNHAPGHGLAARRKAALLSAGAQTADEVLAAAEASMAAALLARPDKRGEEGGQPWFDRGVQLDRLTGKGAEAAASYANAAAAWQADPPPTGSMMPAARALSNQCNALAKVKRPHDLRCV